MQGDDKQEREKVLALLRNLNPSCPIHLNVPDFANTSDKQFGQVLGTITSFMFCMGGDRRVIGIKAEFSPADGKIVISQELDRRGET